MFKNIGWPEILVIALVLVVLFGGKLLPKLGKNIGESGKEMKEAAKELKDVIKEK
jgi:sec-independent protein translocase protein TatA